MTAALKGNANGSGAIQVGGVDAINISTSQIVSFVNSVPALSVISGLTVSGGANISGGASVSGGLSVTSNGFSVAGGGVTLGAGTTGIAPLTFTSGPLVTVPVAGAMEYDGNAFYATDDVTCGRGYIESPHYFRLTSDSTAFGPGIANFFGATSGLSLDPSTFFELEANLYFTKTTSGTVTFTLTFSNAPINANANYVGSQATGIGAVSNPQTAAIVKSTSTAVVIPATGTLSTAANHQYIVRSMFQTNATTGGTINLQITSSAGTVTPLTGSYYKLTRLPAANTGTFA